jgi:hypothetical protein
MLITLAYLCIDENIFHVFFIICLISVYIFKNVFINNFIYYMINY